MTLVFLYVIRVGRAPLPPLVPYATLFRSVQYGRRPGIARELDGTSRGPRDVRRDPLPAERPPRQDRVALPDGPDRPVEGHKAMLQRTITMHRTAPHLPGTAGAEILRAQYN